MTHDTKKKIENMTRHMAKMTLNGDLTGKESATAWEAIPSPKKRVKNTENKTWENKLHPSSKESLPP